MKTFVEAYIEGFKKCYPEKEVAVKYRRKWDKYVVVINQDPGNMMLSEQDLREATRMFNR